MARTIPAALSFAFITKDFESAWDSMAKQPTALPGGGNFMFALQAMMLLELAARVCQADTNGTALTRLSQELARIEPRYFTELPACVAGPGGFALPSMGPNPDRELLRMLFDLIRNGQAHQYRQINVDLADGEELQVWLSGVRPGLVIGSARPPRHLAMSLDPHGNVVLSIVPHILYRDIRDAIVAAGLPAAGLEPAPFARSYGFTSADLIASLQAGGHRELPLPT